MFNWLLKIPELLVNIFGYLRDRQLLKAGRDAARGKSATKTLEESEDVREIWEDIGELNDADVIKRLRKLDDS